LTPPGRFVRRDPGISQLQTEIPVTTKKIIFGRPETGHPAVIALTLGMSEGKDAGRPVGGKGHPCLWGDSPTGGRRDVPDCFQSGRANLSFILQREPDSLSAPDPPYNSCRKTGFPRCVSIHNAGTGWGQTASHFKFLFFRAKAPKGCRGGLRRAWLAEISVWMGSQRIGDHKEGFSWT